MVPTDRGGGVLPEEGFPEGGAELLEPAFQVGTGQERQGGSINYMVGRHLAGGAPQLDWGFSATVL